MVGEKISKFQLGEISQITKITQKSIKLLNLSYHDAWEILSKIKYNPVSTDSINFEIKELEKRVQEKEMESQARMRADITNVDDNLRIYEKSIDKILEKIPEFVYLGFLQKGKKIEEINPSLVRLGSEEQKKYAEQSVWHNKKDIDKFVQKELKLSDEQVKNAQYKDGKNKLWYKVANVISNLRKDGTITDWRKIDESRTGVWRLTNLNLDLDSINKKGFYIALGPWTNWKHTLDNPPFRWGVNPSSASNVGVFNALKTGDIVYFYANQDKPTPFSQRGFFGVGKVIRKYDEESELYWPDEVIQGKVIYKHRFEIEPLKMGQSDSDILPWIEGLPFTKGLNHITNEDTLKPLLDNTEKIWNIKLNESNDIVNHYIITQNEGSRYDDVSGIQYAYDSDKAHYKNFVEGTNFIVQTKINAQNYFVGYGKIGSVIKKSPRVKENGRSITDIVAKFSEYVEFPERKIRTEEINKKMLEFAFPNTGTGSQPPAMLAIDKDLYDEIISGEVKSEIVSEKTFDDSPLIFPRNNLDSIREEIKRELLIDDHIIDQIISSLYSGKNVLLTGPVGTGKTHLAQLIPKLVWKEIGGYYPQTVTATSDWTTQDVIGGIFPKIKNDKITYLIQKGCVAETISQNWEGKQSFSKKRIKKNIDGQEYNGVWLIIDEFNRANIDKAFGQLFTALEYKTLDIPTTDPELSSEKLLIPEDYRIIGTLNTFDKHYLFRLSDALKRRFSFIEILPPPYSKKQEEIKFIAEKAIKGLREVHEELKINSYDDIKKDSSLMEILENLYEIMAYIRLTKNLGTALLISMFRFIIINYLITKDWDKSLDQALMTNLLPQLESLQYWQIDSIMNFIGGRIHELFRKFDIRNRPDIDRYEEELKTLTKYLKLSGKNKTAQNWNSKFRTGEITRENSPILDLNPWNGVTRPNLQNFRGALEGLKQEKGFFETEEINEDAQ